MNELRKAIQFVFARAKWWGASTLLITLLLGCIPLASLWVMKELVNAVAFFIQNESNDYSHALVLLIVQFLITIFGTVLRNIQTYQDKWIEYQLDHDLQQMIASKTTSVPLAYFDFPEFYNHLNRIKGGIGGRFLSPIRSVMQLAEAGIQLVTLIGYLLVVHWSLALLSVVAAVPLFIVQKKFGGQRFWLLLHQTPVAREANYTSLLLTDRQSAKEIRIFGLAAILMKMWSEKFLNNTKGVLKLFRRQQTANVSLEVMTGFLYAGAAFIIIGLTKSARLQIGDFVAVGQAVQNTQGSINMISNTLARIYEETLYIRDFFQFIGFEKSEWVKPKSAANRAFPVLEEQGICFDRVTYRYPGSQREVLKNISFQIQPGERVAIVGENGSGKTTLTKCLIGLYPVSHGQVRYEGTAIENLAEQELYQNISVVFQDFMKYAFTIRDNITFGDLDRREDGDHLAAVAKQTGVDEFTNRFAEGYDTYLGRFLRDGEELSGGQWQKIALARALFGNGQVMILDEPTAALDPQAELEVFQQFDRLTRGKTTIFISHRMASARMADRIFVMKQGELIEVGSHEELLELNGEYAQMYRMQAQWYQDEPQSLQEVMVWKS